MTPHDLFEILVREHAGMLTAYLRAVVRDPGLADDLFQETMLTAWRNLDKFDKTRPFTPWLRGIAGKLLLAARRKNAKGFLPCDAETLDFLEHRHATLHRQTGDTFDDKLDGLRDCLEQLPDQYREAVHLRYSEDLDTTALADRLQLSVENIKKRLQRGRARLLDCLQYKLTAETVNERA